LDRAGAELSQHIRIAAELIIREKLDLELPLRLLLDAIDRLLGAHIHRVRGRLIRSKFVAEPRSFRFAD
jgi:hypothetical protein